MKNAVEQFNALNGKTVTKSQLKELRKLAVNQLQQEVVKRIDLLFVRNPKPFLQFSEQKFKIKLNSKLKWVPTGTGLGATKEEKQQVLDKSKEVNRQKTKRNRTKKGTRSRANAQVKVDISEKELVELRKAYGLGANNSELHGLQELPFSQSAEFGLGKRVAPDDIYQYVTDLIVNTIHKDGLLPWQRSWEKTGLSDGEEATNYESKKGYRGINFFLLNFEPKKDKDGKWWLVYKKWKNPYFLTFNQVEKYKGKIKKGARAYRVVYFTKLYGHSETIANGKKLEFYTYSKPKFKAWISKNRAQLKILKRAGWSVDRLANVYIPILKYYNVFNAGDITGIKWDKIPVNDNASKTEKQKIAIAESIVDNYPKPPKIIYKGDQPQYRPGSDTVYQTPIKDFKNPQSFYSVLFHELIHSTGAKKRLNRDLSGGNRSASYAKEELVAEMGAVFLCAESGILFETLNNSAAYLKGWNGRLVKNMEKDNRFFFRAASKAQAGSDHILSPDKNGIPKYRKSRSGINKKNVTSEKKKTGQLGLFGRKKKTTSKKRLSPGKKSKSKKGLGNPIILDSGTSHSTNAPKRTEHNGDASASVLDLPVISKEVSSTVKVSPDATAKRTMPDVAKPKTRKLNFGRKMNAVGGSRNEVYNLAGPLDQILGGIEKKPKGSVVVTLDAEQGAGKTRMFFQAINAYANAKNDVTFLSLEEHPDSNLFTSKRDQYLNEYAQQNVTVISDEEVTKENIEAIFESSEIIFTDSFGKLYRILGGIDLDNDIRKKHDGKIFFFIYQRTSDGKMRGGSASAFDADIVAKMEKDYEGRNHKMYFNKNRYEKVPGLKYNINTQSVENETLQEVHSGPMVLN